MIVDHVSIVCLGAVVAAIGYTLLIAAPDRPWPCYRAFIVVIVGAGLMMRGLYG